MILLPDSIVLPVINKRLVAAACPLTLPFNEKHVQQHCSAGIRFYYLEVNNSRHAYSCIY